MKKCAQCGTLNPDTSKFCSECGAPLADEPAEQLIKEAEVDTVDSKEAEEKKEMNECKSCGRLIPRKAKKCPFCGAKQKKPVYRRVWFWILIAFLLLIIIAAIAGSDSADPAGGGGNTSAPEETVVETQQETVPQTEAAKITEIRALYTGDTEAGTTINNDSQIEVTQVFSDGTEQTTDDWTVEKPKTLKAGKVSKVTISSGGLTTEMSVACTTEDPESYKKECEDIAYKDIARNPDKYTGKNVHFHGKVVQVQESGSDVILRVSTKDDGYGNWYDDVVLVSYTLPDGSAHILEDDMVDLYGTCAGTTTYESVLGGDITIPSMAAEFVDIAK